MLEEVVGAPVPQSTIDAINYPYDPNCMYIKNASISLRPGTLRTRQLILDTEMSVPFCYYARDKSHAPKHLNGTDYTLCFNEMFYVLIAESVRRSFVPELPLGTVDDVKRAQMEEILIGDMKMHIKFRTKVTPTAFLGRIVVNKAYAKDGSMYYFMDTRFSNSLDGPAQTAEFQITVLPEHNHADQE